MHSTETQEIKQGSVTGYAPVNGLKMYYEIHGKGAPLVLIHGGGSTIQTSFARVLHSLANHRQVIAVELQGHGHTTDGTGPETFEQDADDVAGLLKYLKIDNADFFGFSNGGNTAMRVNPVSFPGSEINPWLSIFQKGWHVSAVSGIHAVRYIRKYAAAIERLLPESCS